MIVSDISCIAALWLILSRSFQVETPLLLRFIVKGLGKTPHVWAGKSTAFPIDLLNLLKRLGSRWRFPTFWAWHLDMLLGTILPDPVALWLQNNLYIVIPFPLKITLLWVIPTLTHYSDLVSDLPFRSIYCIYIYILKFYLTFFLAYTLTFFLTSILASILAVYLAFFLTYSDIMFGIVSGILSGLRSDPGTLHSILRWPYGVWAQAWPTASGDEEGGERGRDPHLAGQKIPRNRNQTRLEGTWDCACHGTKAAPCT